MSFFSILGLITLPSMFVSNCCVIFSGCDHSWQGRQHRQAVQKASGPAGQKPDPWAGQRYGFEENESRKAFDKVFQAILRLERCRKTEK